MELITHASASEPYSEQTGPPAELCFCLVGTVSRFVLFHSKWMFSSLLSFRAEDANEKPGLCGSLPNPVKNIYSFRAAFVSH